MMRNENTDMLILVLTPLSSSVEVDFFFRFSWVLSDFCELSSAVAAVHSRSRDNWVFDKPHLFWAYTLSNSRVYQASQACQ